MKSNTNSFWFAGIFFLLAWVGMILSSFFPPFETGLILFKITGGSLFFGLIGFFFLRTAIRRTKHHRRAIDYGIPLNAVVIKHGRRFNPFSSWRYYTITIQAQNDGFDAQSLIKSTSSNLHIAYPIGSIVKIKMDRESGTMVIVE